MPRHLLELKLGQPVELLTSVDTANGFHQSLRVVVHFLRAPRDIVIEVADPSTGKTCRLRREHFEKKHWGVHFTRAQYPVRTLDA